MELRTSTNEYFADDGEELDEVDLAFIAYIERGYDDGTLSAAEKALVR